MIHSYIVEAAEAKAEIEAKLLVAGSIARFLQQTPTTHLIEQFGEITIGIGVYSIWCNLPSCPLEYLCGLAAEMELFFSVESQQSLALAMRQVYYDFKLNDVWVYLTVKPSNCKWNIQTIKKERITESTSTELIALEAC